MRQLLLTIVGATPILMAACTGDTGPTGPAGETGGAGTAGDPCSVVDNGDGTFTMTCPGSDPISFGSDEEPTAYTSAELVRGGQLYEKFWAVAGAGADEPTTDHPLYPSFGTQTAGTTWRCKECHGWDYIGRDGAYSDGSHYTGIAGLFPASESVWSAFLTISQDHGYSTLGLADDDIWDLVKFYREGMIDIDTAVSAEGDFLGSASSGEALYNAGVTGFDSSGIASNAPCANCHGSDGTNDNPGGGSGFEEFPGLIANENPSEFLHKVRFGHAGSSMPSIVEINASLQDAVDMGAYSQRLSPILWSTTDPARGGQLYDKFWNVTGVTAVEPTTTHPMYPTLGAKTLSTTWRCKECHGWDYIGDAGRYASGSHYTGIAGLFPATLSKWDVYESIKDDHGYGDAGLTDTDIWDLVSFYDAGMEDLSFILNPDGTFRGTASAGATLYDTTFTCAACHDADGLNVNPPGGSNGAFTNFPGLLSWDNPQEFTHKARFGHPGTTMIKTFDSGSTVDQIGDLGVHSQTLPCAAGPLFWDPVAGACL